jgi:endogenous inhibitor of DNA gyrase (YacG/DUF329 family)
MPILHCPTCNKPFDPEQTTAMPFCSERCQRIDLYRWLNEEYGLPMDRSEESAREEKPPDFERP